MTGGVTVEEIARTQDTATSVFRAEHDSASMTFLFPQDEPQDVWVHTVRSRERGGMKRLLDHVCSEYGCESIRFVNTLNDHLKDRLDGAEEVGMEITGPHPASGETVSCVDVEWST